MHARDGPQSANRVHNMRVQRHKARLHGLHEEQAAFASSSGNLGRLRLGEHRGLLAEHHLSRIERPQGPSMVKVVRQGEVDGVDLGVCKQRLVVAVGPGARRARNLGKKCCSLLCRPAARRNKLGSLNLCQARREPMRDVACAQDTEVNHLELPSTAPLLISATSSR